MKNFDSRLTKLEKMIDDKLNPSEEIAIFVIRSIGETKKGK